jgi:hypothetical protein
MSWSLTLSPRLSPAVLPGVSKETLRSPARLEPTQSSGARSNSQLICIAPHDFPEQLSAPCGALLALGANTELKELPITAA